jgi:threonine aldolase
MDAIDLRSDTVTRPTPAMREAMMRAPLGDDVLGDDPSVLALQERVAALMGKQAACFVPSGTMANQTAIRAQTEPGDEIICHEGSHIFHYEGGGPAVLSGCMCRVVDTPDGTFDHDVIGGLIRPDDSHFCRSRLLVLENTHNRGGGTVWPLERLARVSDAAAARGLRRHLDGARLWNATVASGVPVAAWAGHFDTVAACFSKGLGCPVGSIVVGDRATIARVHRARKLLGGGMRQAGMLAAAAMHALDHHIERLAVDHANARELWQALMKAPGIEADPGQPRGPMTNLVFFRLGVAVPVDAAELQRRLEARGVLAFATGPRRMRMVTHMDVTSGQCAAAAKVTTEVLAGL